MIKVIEHAVVRVAAWPIECLDELRSPDLVVLAEQLQCQRDAYRAACEQLARSLTTVVPRLGRDSRRLALTARRAAHRGTAISMSNALRNEILRHSARCAALIGESAALRDKCAATEHHYAQALQTAAATERRALLNLAASPAFDRALAFANPLLARRVRAAGTGQNQTQSAAAARRVHASLLGYALRAAGRPTPAGAWAGVAEVLPAPDGAERIVVSDAPPRRRIGIDMRPFLSLLGIVAATDSGRHVSLRLMRLPPAAALYRQDWYDAWRQCDGALTSVHDLMTRTGAGLDEVCAEVRQAIKSGWLAVAQLYDTSDDLWHALRSLGRPLDGEAARCWTGLVDTAQRVCRQLELEWQTIGSAEIAAAEAPLRHAFNLAGVTVPPEVALFLVDTTAAVRVSWDQATRARITQALEEAFRLLAADGSAEQLRRDLVRIHLLGHPAKRGGDPAAVGRWPWTRGAPPQERAAVQRWQTLLRTRWRDHMVRVPPQMLAPKARAGPAGDHLVTGDDTGRIWLLRGRPQPGMFAGRHDHLLRGPGQTASPYWRCLDAHLHDSPSPNPVDVALERPAAPTTAFRPELNDRWTSGRVRASPLLVDAELRAWLLDADRLPRLPLYTSAAAPAADDPEDHLALSIAFSHGWEYLSIGFPALPEELLTWHHLPRLSLPCAAVLSARRWTMTAEAVIDLHRLPQGERFLAWRSRMTAWGVPDWVNSSLGTVPDGAPLPVPTDSLIVAEYLLHRAATRRMPIVLSELPEGFPSTIGLRDGSHRAELAVTWVASAYPGPFNLAPQTGVHDA